MKAVILVGGLGRRLRPYTFSIPKPLLPVGDTPVLELIIRGLARAQIKEVILATGYQAQLIEAFCGDGARFGVTISYVHEDQPLGTAGPLSLLRDRVAPDELLLVMNGDIVTGLDLGVLADYARERSFDLTVAYATHTYQSPFGVLELEQDRVVGIVEKPSVDYAISAGMYIVRSEVLELIPYGSAMTIPQLVEMLLERGMSVGAFHVEEFWLGLEHLESFEQAINEFGHALGRGNGHAVALTATAHGA